MQLRTGVIAVLPAALGLTVPCALGQDGSLRPGTAFTVTVHQVRFPQDQPPDVSDEVVHRTVVSNDAGRLVIHNSFPVPSRINPAAVEAPGNQTVYDRFLPVATHLASRSPSGGAPVLMNTETACDRAALDGFFPLARVATLSVPCTLRLQQGDAAVSERPYTLNLIYEGRSELALPIGTFAVHAIRTVQTQQGLSTITRYQFSPDLGLSLRSETEVLRLEGPVFQQRSEVVAIER